MKKIAIFTTTRAEFGLLSGLIKKIDEDIDLEALLFVGGTHLKKESGYTIDEIKNSGFKITDTYDYLTGSGDEISISKSLSLATSLLADIFNKHTFDFVCVLGDRYELLAIVSNAIIFRKPIIHIHGGEITEGAFDDQIRNMVTKAAHLHFAASDVYAENIRKMGESEWRIHNTGALAVDNMKKLPLHSKMDLFKKLGLDENKPTVLMTYHPVTLEFSISPIEQIQNLFDALESNNIQLVITAPNVDNYYEQIMNFIQLKVQNNPDYHFFKSLGILNYLSLIPHCEYVIGNSSSGIIEVPFFKIPVINIGTRQKGRIRHSCIIDCDYTKDSIRESIEKAKSPLFNEGLKDMEYKFGSGNTAEKMVEIIKNTNIDNRLLIKTAHV